MGIPSSAGAQAPRPIIEEISRVRRSWTPAETKNHIAKLPIWKGTPQIKQRFGGLQNRTFFVTEPSGKRYAVRVGFDQFRTRQTTVVQCTIAAHKLGLGPRLVYAEPNLSVVEFVEGRQMGADELREPKMLAHVIERMKTLHEGAWAIEETISYWWPFDTVRRYCRTLLAGKLATGYQPSAWASWVPQFLDATNRLEKVIAPFTPKFTHNDMVFVNMMVNPRNEVMFIDWDGGGYGHPMWDLGEMLMWIEADDDVVRFALEQYYGALDQETLAQRVLEVRAFQLMATIRMATECMEHVLDPYYFLTPEEVAEGMKANIPPELGIEPSLAGLIELVLPRFQMFWDQFKDQL